MINYDLKLGTLNFRTSNEPERIRILALELKKSCEVIDIKILHYVT